MTQLKALIIILIVILCISVSSMAQTAPSPSLKYISQNSKIAGYDPVSYFGVLDTTSGMFQHYRGDSYPLSLASVVKVVVALAVLDDLETGKYTLNSPAILPGWASGDGSAGTTVVSNLERMLGPSDNSATNALIIKAGGFDQVNAKIKKYGLTKTTVTCMLSPIYLNSSTCRAKNLSTMRDLVRAMDVIRTKNTINSLAMTKPMINTKYTYNHTNRVMNKTGLNSKSLGDVGVFEITQNGVRKTFVYALIVDFPYGGGGYYDSRTEPLPGTVPTTSLTDKRDPVSKATQWLINDLSQGFVIKNSEF
ncbi:MAG: serine hydrolase [Patescibacteria group bacterium]